MSNIAVTQGSGKTVATETIGGIEYQLIKLYSGAAASTDPIQTDGSGNLLTKINVALPTGTNSIGQVTANAGTNLNTSLLALEGGGNLATLAGGVTSSIFQSNVAKINNVTPLMGSGNTGTGSLRVTIATDQPALTNSQPHTQTASTMPSAITMQSAATGSGNGTSLPVTGYATAILNIVSSPSMSGGTTVNFEASVDDTTWVAINAHGIGTFTLSTTSTVDGDFRINCTGYKSVRARISAYSAGTVTIKGYSTVMSGPLNTVVIAAGSSVIGTVTANAGTNLNTSLLALEGGGNLATIAGAITSSIMQSNIAKINNVTPLMGAGNTGTGSLRVTIASDQASVAVAATLQSNTGVDIGKLTANQSVNVAQINGVTVLMGAGNTGTGSQRVTIASDQASIPVAATLQANSGVDIGKLTANQSVNVSQVNAHTLVEGGQNGVQSVGGVVATNTNVSTAGFPLLVAGSDYGGTPKVQSIKVDSSGLQYSVNSGVAAQGASVSGNPILIGCEARETLGTQLTDGQVSRKSVDRYGRTIVVKPKLSHATSNASAITTNTNTTLVAAPSANTHLRIHRIHVTNSSATATMIYFCDGTPGTKSWPTYLQQGAVVSIPIDGTWDLTGTASPKALVANTATTGANIEWHIVYETVGD